MLQHQLGTLNPWYRWLLVAGDVTPPSQGLVHGCCWVLSAPALWYRRKSSGCTGRGRAVGHPPQNPHWGPGQGRHRLPPSSVHPIIRLQGSRTLSLVQSD